MSIVGKIRKLKSAIKCGGYSEISIGQINYEQCLLRKKILVTGASSGIGFQIARKCCLCGATVVITGRNEEKLIKAKKIIGDNCKYTVWDQSDIDSIQNKIQEVLNLMGGEIDCLVNNAGLQPDEFFPFVTEREWDRIYNTNSKGLYFLTQEICNYWISHKGNGYKKIISIDSQGGFVGATYPYRMVKWDIRGLTKGLGLRMAKEGVLVNAIAPGIVKTEMQKFAIEQGENAYCDQNPLRRFCLPEEVAEMAVFMISDACNFMVGQTILIDGGYSLR